MPGRNVGPTCGQREKSTSCLKRGEQISFGESRAEESASIAAGVPILRKVKRARYLTNRERDGSRKVIVRVETSASMYERDDGLRSDEGSAGAGSSDVNCLQKINKGTRRRLVDPRVLLLRFWRFGLAILRIVPLNLCKSNLARFPHFLSLIVQELFQRRYALRRRDCSHGLGRFMANHGVFLQISKDAFEGG